MYKVTETGEWKRVEGITQLLVIMSYKEGNLSLNRKVKRKH